MEGDESTASGGSLQALARLADARSAKQEVDALRLVWSQEVGSLVNEQDSAIDALIQELDACRMQLTMQRDALSMIEVCSSSVFFACFSPLTP